MKHINKTDHLIIESLVNKYGSNCILNELNVPTGVKKLALAGAIGAGILGLNKIQHNSEHDNIEPLRFEDTYEYALILNDAIIELEDFMERAIKRQGGDVNLCKLDPQKMIQHCIDNNFDIGLLVAQANLESCFGSTNRCQRTNSVFSLGSYDNGKNVCVYNTQDDSILPYIRTIKRDYLNNGELSVDDIINDHCFVNKNGYRYAQDKSYESKIRNIRNRFFKECPTILELSQRIDPNNYYDYYL